VGFLLSLINPLSFPLIRGKFCYFLTFGVDQKPRYLPNAKRVCASKAGIMGFTRAAALDMAPFNIRVNAVAPGAIATPGTSNVSKDALNSIVQAIPERRMGKPADIGEVVAFLASDLAGFITGAYIPVCGGNVMPGI